MKKIISMVLALVMVMGLSVTAMAEDGDTPKVDKGTVVIKDFSQTNPNTIDVPAKGSVAPFTKDKETYYVIMGWSVESTLTYTVGKEDYKWNVYNVDNSTETLLTGETPVTGKTATMGRYDVNGKWSGYANITVNVTNWSNVDITAKATWKDSAKPEEGATDNGVTKDIRTQGITSTSKDITRADSSITKDNYTTAKAENIQSTELFKVKIDNDTENAPCKIVDGAIKNTDGGYSAIIGTLTVTIAKKTATP